MRWFADNSELIGVKDAEIPDILMFGGVICSDAIERELRAEVERIKARYGHPRAPIKWNMRDLRDVYRRQGMEPLYRTLLDNSREWRMEIFQALASFDIKLIVSCIESYSSKRDQIKKNKQELVSHCFSNGLMRFGLLVRDYNKGNAQVVLDWPERDDAVPFNREYSCAFNRGVTAGHNIKYHCGPLSALGFMDSATFTNMKHSTLLQVADLVVGASRELIECCLEKRVEGHGVACARIVREKYYGFPAVLGRGIVVSTGNSVFRRAVAGGVGRYLYRD